MNIQEKLKTKLSNNIDDLSKQFLSDSQEYFNTIWEDFTKEAQDKKEEIKREGLALQGRNDILKKENEDLENKIELLNNEKTIIDKELKEAQDIINKSKEIKKELDLKHKELENIENKQLLEKENIKADRDKISAEMILLRDKENSIKRAFASLNK